MDTFFFSDRGRRIPFLIQCFSARDAQKRAVFDAEIQPALHTHFNLNLRVRVNVFRQIYMYEAAERENKK